MLEMGTHADVLKGVLEVMTPETWHQGAALDPGNFQRRCVLGHMHSVASELMIGAPYQKREAIIKLLDASAKTLFPERAIEPQPSLQFNDHPWTSYEDVRLVVKHALYEAEELALQVG